MQRILMMTHMPLSSTSGGGTRLRGLLNALGEEYSVTLLSLAYPPDEHKTGAVQLPDSVEHYEAVPPQEEPSKTIPRWHPVRLWRSVSYRSRSALGHLHGSGRQSSNGNGIIKSRPQPSGRTHALPSSIRYFARLYGRNFRAQAGCLIAERDRFDVIDVDQYLAMWLPSSMWSIPRVVTFYDVLTDSLRRELEVAGGEDAARMSDLELMQGYERRLARAFESCITVSEVDKERLAALEPRARIRVVRNSIDTAYYGASSIERVQPETMIFTGSMSYRPNVDGAVFFSNEIHPLICRRAPRSRLQIVGHQPAPDVKALACDDVAVTGYVADIRPPMEAANVVIVPLRLGGGTRLKLLEAMSMGKAIVSTSVGCEGLQVRHGEHLLIADSPEEFADCVLRLFDDSDLCERMGRNGRLLVEREYSNQQSARRLCAAYEEAIEAASQKSYLTRSLRYVPLNRQYKREQWAGF